jgi:hypothetical protein
MPSSMNGTDEYNAISATEIPENALDAVELEPWTSTITYPSSITNTPNSVILYISSLRSSRLTLHSYNVYTIVNTIITIGKTIGLIGKHNNSGYKIFYPTL